jgi:3-hydroxyacyl-CoA dehydrogenase/enoyl-CoA hydratase/3-hydroxybutyryl-CoA epimerase
MTTQYIHWQLTKDTHNLLWLGLDRKGKSVNSIDKEILNELDEIISTLSNKLPPNALIIYSMKPTGFIAGADIEQFKGIDDPAIAIDLIGQGQRVFDKLERLPCTTVAMIDGFCLGGGYELALACDYRIASLDSKTKLGLPEIKLGIHPGWGGTVRLPRLIGSLKALDLILTGKSVPAKVAQKMGMVDIAVPKRLLKQATTHLAQNPPKRKALPVWNQLIELDFVRPFIAKIMSNKIKSKVKKSHYPAPFSVIDNWQEYGVQHPQALTVELESMGRLVVGETAKNLVRVFFLQDRLKNEAKSFKFKAKHVHVIGAGVMGGDIAAWCAMQGLRVTLQDQKPEFLTSAMKRAHQLAVKKLREPHEVQNMMDRLIPDCKGEGVAQADVIIEAITEKLEAKQSLFAKLEAQAKPDAILATNTSTIQLEEIRQPMQNPKRLIGIHFFNPVAQMPLVEVVHSDDTDEAMIGAGLAFVKQINKLPLAVKSAPGFLVNRILLPYMLEAVSLLEEGVAGPVIDKAAMEFGMPMGPIELADTVGLDVCLHALEKLAESFGYVIPPVLREAVRQGDLGRKTGKGFYEYKNDKPIKEKVVDGFIPQDIIDRLSLRMVNESVACLREGIVKDADLLDAGTIFGCGFAPFRGGPIHYVRSSGFDVMRKQLEQLETRYGDRFQADSGWHDVA